MTLYTNGETVWTYEQMRDVEFPAEIEGVDMDQFIGGELSFEDWLAESLNTGIYKKVDEESLGRGRSESGRTATGSALSWPRNLATTQRVWRPRTLPGIAKRSLSARPERKAGERDGWGPYGYKWRQWDRLKDERRRREIETQGRASVAD